MNSDEFLRRAGPLHWQDYAHRFPEAAEIGRDVLGEVELTFHDNGEAVGAWRYHRPSTVGRGEVLGEEDAACARDRYRRRKEQHGARAR